MTKNSFLLRMDGTFLRSFSFFLIFTTIIIISQFIILKPHLEFGFSPDDVLSIAYYLSFGTNPFVKFPEFYKYIGPEYAQPIFYVGTLFTFFGFNYQAYQVAALIFKIFSIISFYLLIQMLFKKTLLSFISGLIYSFHYGSVGSMEMVARTQDYLVIVGLNFFLIIFYLIVTGKIRNIIWKFFSSIILFLGFFINPIRAYPILPFLFLIEIVNLIKNKTKNNLYNLSINLVIYLLPFIILFLLVEGKSGANLGNILGTIQETLMGNWQLLLTPITTLGSYFLIGDGLKLLGLSNWSTSTYFSYIFWETSIFFGVITLVLSFFLSKKKLRFFLYILVTNFLLELVLFLFFDRGLGKVLPADIQVHYDISYIPPTILGLYILILTFFIFLEWLQDKRNTFYAFYLVSIMFTIIFIGFTWIFSNHGYIALGINGYSTIPSMGISGAMAAVLVLIYTKLKNYKSSFKYFAPFIFLILIPYFYLSNSQIRSYLQKNIKNGNNAADQIRLKDKFWSMVNEPESCNKLFFLDSRNDYDNGYFYSFILLDRFQSWYSIYNPYHSKKPCPVAFIISDEQMLAKSYTVKNGQLGFIAKNSDYEEVFSNLDNFHAFRFHDRDVFNIKDEVLSKLEK